MKIVCGSCSAKYSIADEKVQGKVFKIRCRKCSNVIVVKGTEDEASGASNAAPYGGTASTPEWYVVIDGEQVGPLTPEDLEGYYTNGQVSLESFIWRDGMSDWTPIGQVEVFAHLAMGGGYMDEEDATSLVDSPMQAASDYEDDATAVVDAGEWRNQQAAQEAEEAAAASVGAGGYAAADFGGFDAGSDPYAADPYGADLYGAGSSVASADPYGASDPYAMSADPYGTPSQAEMQQGYGELDAGFGSEPSSDLYGGADGGYSAQASLGGDGGGLFSSFDADADNDGGLAYQSFSGLDSLQASGVDLNSGGGGHASYNANTGNAAASTSNGFDDANDLVGSRNENSVLFSLSSLQQVEAVKGPASNDVPLTDGSGLIDIRSLASAHKSMSGAGGAGAPGGAPGPFDGPSSAPAVETFSPATMSVPAIMPRGTHRDNKPLLIAVVTLALLLGVGGVLAAVYVMNKEPEIQKEIIREVQVPVPAVAAKEDGTLSKEEQADAIARAVKEQVDKKEAENAANAGTAEEQPDDDKDDKSGKSTKKTRDTSSKSKDTDSKSVSSVTAKDPDPPKKDTKLGSSSDIDALLGKIDKKDAPKKEEPSVKDEPEPVKSASTVKKKLDKTDVQNTVRKYNGRISTCGSSSNAGGLKGKVWVQFSVAPSGKVSSSSIASSSASFNGTDVGNCVLSVVRGMKFPEAQESTDISKYPFFI